MLTHIKINYKGIEHSFVVSLTPQKIERVELFNLHHERLVMVARFEVNELSIYDMPEELWDSYITVHRQPIKDAMVKASDFMEWYLSECTEREFVAEMLKKNGKVTALDLFKCTGHIPKDICGNIKVNKEEYMPTDLIFIDDYCSYRDEYKYIIL
jgi:hypothetical protein